MKYQAFFAAAVGALLSACSSSGGPTSSEAHIGGTPKLPAAATSLSLKVPSEREGVLEEGYTDINGKRTEYQTVGSNYYIKIDGKTYRAGDKISLAAYPQGLTEKPLDSGLTLTITGQQPYQAHYDGTLKLYKQKYSVIAASYVDNQYRSNNGNRPEKVGEFSVDDIQGEITPYAKLPANGRYTYTGEAFNGRRDKGVLSYTVDFAKKTGSGTVTGMKDFGLITLKEADITRIDDKPFAGGSGLEGEAVSAKGDRGDYGLGLFGPKAEELAGSIDLVRPGKDDDEAQEFSIGVGGKRAN